VASLKPLFPEFAWSDEEIHKKNCPQHFVTKHSMI